MLTVYQGIGNATVLDQTESVSELFRAEPVGTVMKKRILARFGAVILMIIVPWCGVQAAGLSGEIKVKGKRPPKNLVVYLTRDEATDNADAGKVTISQRNAIFSPKRVVVVKGGSVKFVNDEEQDIDHNVYSLSRKNKFDIGLAAKGSIDEVVFKTSGIVKFFCSVHKNMQGTVFVVPSKYYAVLEKPGKFEIDDVPEGKWTVNVSVAHRRYKAKPQRVTIAGDGADNVVVLVSKKR
jgi:plastocyanin